MRFTTKNTSLWLILSWLSVGFAVTIAAFTQLLYPALSLALLLPLVWTAMTIVKFFASWSTFTKTEQVLSLALGTVWLVHGVGVAVPETGFDAVWYHLPVAKAMVAQHGFVYLPDMYQSLNPLFSDLIFTLGYQFGGETGAKGVAYLFGLSLILLLYSFSSLQLQKKWALALCLMVSTFQVVSWQSSSFYVDIAKAFWELAALYVLAKSKVATESQWRIVLAGILLGASLATKAFSILLVPVFLVIVWLWVKKDTFKAMLMFGVVTMVSALPFYLRTWWYGGTPFLALSLPMQNLHEIGGSTDMFAYIGQRLLSLPTSVFTLTFEATDYISIAIVVLLPFTVWFLWQHRSRYVLGLTVFALGQWLVWWFVPPLSTRYALAGFVIVILLTVWAVKTWTASHPKYYDPLVLVFVLSVVLNLAPRLVVLNRQLKYILGAQTSTEYLQQFRDGSIDDKLDAWYETTSF